MTVKFYLAPGVRNRKFYLAPGMRNGKIYLAPNDSYEKFYLAVKGLIATNGVGGSYILTAISGMIINGYSLPVLTKTCVAVVVAI